MSTPLRCCPECANPLPPSRQRIQYCSTACRKDFNNRRAMRGAELYDLFRAMRRERDAAKAMNIWTELCRLELNWQQEDEKQRPGRRSYMKPATALDLLYLSGRLTRAEILVPSKRRDD